MVDLKLNVTVNESETFPICAELTSGYLERDIFVGLAVDNGNTIRECQWDNYVIVYRMHT